MPKMGAQLLLPPGPHPQPTGEKDSMLETTCLAPIHHPSQNRHPRVRLRISKPQSSNSSQMALRRRPNCPRRTQAAGLSTHRTPPCHWAFVHAVPTPH